ncbi:MalY/PatB family protein [Yimella sp. cx-51]|uniref:MalY/PatB family protein n=1 Tax=Yimella sp. cx-51 TaxID=2770551 RepID=UPI00165D3225|nr:aminotransferase class I/II-fold pyridoxal phosphate-dependent enzyme [Yimella sp. cx-51]MBC9957768.1 aminotransferase class I/II-fold pyridoxal phosphate-dependent enzyme [Yimella sp. cx-51]QTH36888.1 aminotransferase class I/II-fold pyridoxal phosphate-dependent enzyme [Yimella sp. cx-51]
MEYEILTATSAQARSTHTSVKWEAFGPDVLPLWVAEMDAQPCPAVVESISAAVRRGDTGYGWGPRYAEALAEFASDTWEWRIPASRVTVVADAMIGVAEVLREVTDVEGSIVVSSPCYDSFHGFIDMLGRHAADAPLGADGRLDLAAIEIEFARVSATGRRSAYLLSNPQNPTGTVHTAAELTALAKVANQYGVTVVSDEIHAPLVFEGAFTPYLTVPGGSTGFSVISASKAWNLAALKSAAVISGENVDPRLRLMHDMHTHGASHFGILAHVAAFRDGRDWLRQLRTELDANRHLLADLLSEHLPNIAYTPPASTYLAWLDCRATGLGDDPASHWRSTAGVALSSGIQYGPVTGRGFARLNFATSPQILTEAITRIALAG